MRFGSRILLACALTIASPFAAIADDWSSYDNARFLYAIDIPPGFSAIAEADNSDGGVSTSATGHAELRIWGAYLGDQDFASDIADRIQSETSDGWKISYDRRLDEEASWSGSKGDRVVYVRAITGCDDAVLYFRLEYDRSSLKAYDAVVGRLVKSLRPAC
jgi:hypothetical protein